MALRVEAAADHQGQRGIATAAVLALGVPVLLAWFGAVGFAALWLIRAAVMLLAAWILG
ncbi:hypothetical protein [Methylobacterium sp. JK268]